MEIDEFADEPRDLHRTIRTIAIIAVVAVLILLMALSSTTVERSLADQVWDERATLGSLEAKNYYVMYTDLSCPYCDVFSRLAYENEAEFEEYLSEHDILFELRITRMNYENHELAFSKDSAEAAYCAMNENKFWDYYHNAVQSLWDDYQSLGYGAYKGAPEIENMPDDYWLQIGYEVGLGDDFTACVANHDTAELVAENTERASVNMAKQGGSGLPFFVFDSFVTAGFDNSWGWDMVLEYLDAGLS